ncbi:MAG: hypothetical protein M3256_21840 [Actinomycetota bacterium]|nr:hypothetical protein [Actinomycetota bacterium]
MDPAAPLLSQLRIPKPGEVRKVWPSEPAHFTPWLAEHLDVLSDQLELGALELVKTEVQIPGTARALDILARLPTGDLVAIENQFGTADHDHLTRGLAYAVGLEAHALVVVAEGHLNEFRAVASYLNSLAERSEADHRIGVYLVALSVENVEEYVIPRLSLIESPNAWLQAASEVETSGLQTIDEFLAKVPWGARELMQVVVDWWTLQPGGTIRHGAQTAISLDRPHPTHHGKPLSHIVFNDTGTYTVNRGYLIEAGVVPPDKKIDFDSMLHSTFPDLGWTAKQYFLTGRKVPTIGAVEGFLNWLTAASDEPSQGMAASPTLTIAHP